MPLIVHVPSNIESSDHLLKNHAEMNVGHRMSDLLRLFTALQRQDINRRMIVILSLLMAIAIFLASPNFKT